MTGNPWTTLSSRVAYENPWLRVREDEVVRPDGTRGIYGVVELPESVGIIALDENDRLALVEQWRYTLGKDSLEIPTGGSVESDSSLRGSAERELREETGLVARSWTYLGSIDNSNGVTTDVAHLYLATDLVEGSSDQDAEELIELKWVSFGSAVEQVMSGAITESVSVAGILKAEVLRSRRVLDGERKGEE